MVPKPYQIPDIHRAHFITGSSPVCLEAKKSQTMWLPFRKRLPPPSSHPGDPKPHGEHRCFPIHLTGPPFPNGLGSPNPQPTGHTGGVQKRKSGMSSPFSFPYSVCKESSCFLPRERDVTPRHLRKQQLHYNWGSYDYMTLSARLKQRETERPRFMFLRDVSGLIGLDSFPI